jgi:hypothetical protein
VDVSGNTGNLAFTGDWEYWESLLGTYVMERPLLFPGGLLVLKQS